MKNLEAHSYIFLLAKKAHADVVPEWGAFRHCESCHAILIHGHIEIAMCLHHASRCQDSLGGNTPTEYITFTFKGKTYNQKWKFF